MKNYLILVFILLLVVSCSGGERVATVDGEKITISDFEEMYSLSGAEMSKSQFLNDIMIPDKIILKEAYKSGIEDPSNSEIETVIDNFGGDSLLEKTKLTKSQLEDLISEQIVVAKFLTKTLPPPLVTEQEFNTFYLKANIPSDVSKEEVNALLVKVKGEMLKRQYVLSIASKHNVEIVDNVEEILSSSN